ncbi:MAG: phage integrase N-terminal SAM-like domain-containing protein [Candidatus Marinimicrobia bacterium]|nr:phage integrase N-terminal SAM-like domain-containing protein [Candidatus Neomarinimicrobiota bacterium]
MLELLEYHKNKKENKKTTAFLSWTEAVSKLYKEIKKRGYTKSTLKTYTHWVYHFNNFISKENCLYLNTDDVQQFLEHLAVIKKVKYLSITIHLFLFFLFN